jgi:CRP-like cAMP-binding protein
MIDNTETAVESESSIERQAAVSAALISVFRGKFCDVLLLGRKPITFRKHQVIYEVGDKDRSFIFLQNGFAKVGTITASGREVIYDVRKGGDVVGELCAAEHARLDRAVALEETEAIPVPYQQIIELLSIKPQLLPVTLDVFCQALKEAYEQVNTLAIDDMVLRLKKVLVALAKKLGQRTGSLVEIPTYLTQEEIAHMVGARRERISTALNALRRQGAVHYSTRGHFVLNMQAFEASHSL